MQVFLAVEEDKGKLVDPSFIGGGKYQGLLHVAVETFNHAIGAGMVRGCPDYLGSKKDHQLVPEFRLKLGTVVDNNYPGC